MYCPLLPTNTCFECMMHIIHKRNMLLWTYHWGFLIWKVYLFQSIIRLLQSPHWWTSRLTCVFMPCPLFVFRLQMHSELFRFPPKSQKKYWSCSGTKRSSLSWLPSSRRQPHLVSSSPSTSLSTGTPYFTSLQIIVLLWKSFKTLDIGWLLHFISLKDFYLLFSYFVINNSNSNWKYIFSGAYIKSLIKLINVITFT